MTWMLRIMRIYFILSVNCFKYGLSFCLLPLPSQLNRLESERKVGIRFNEKQERNKIIKWNRSLVSDSREDVEKIENIAKKIDNHHNHFGLSDKITRSLDIHPLLESLSRHCTTRRGRNAVLNLASNPTLQKSSRSVIPGNKSSRRLSFFQYKKVSSGVDLYDETRTNPLNTQPKISIINISQTALEARQEYLRINEAMGILKQSKDKIKNNDENNEEFKKSQNDKFATTTIPPIYGCDSSPWDVNKDAITDDDEWLLHKGSDYSLLDLENVIQAEQIVKTLLDCRRWSDSQFTEMCAPSLAEIGKQIKKDELEFIYEKLQNTVVIKRAETIADITGSKSYSFQLNKERFPQLILLRKKESEIMVEMDKTMKNFLNKMRVPNSNKQLEAFEMDGRLVVPTPRKYANSVGTVRGMSKNSDWIYVEPTPLVEKSNQLTQIREELSIIEQEITQQLIAHIFKYAKSINLGLDYIARLDVIFARAAFGITMNAVVPIVRNEGIINIESFMHPLLAIRKQRNQMIESKKLTTDKVVPIDLKLGYDNTSDMYEGLIISGPNGGGKTIAMKSFGLAAIMCKLGIPIPVNTQLPFTSNGEARVDFFSNILVEVGDHQSILDGDSTLISRINSYSEIIQRVSSKFDDTTDIMNVEEDQPLVEQRKTYRDSLILLDELGGGTDPVAGAAIAQAILEKMLESNRCCIVATTHSLQLKSLPLNNTKFHSAAVLLSDEVINDRNYKLPTFQLAYGSIGDSYGLGAASRASPSLPDDVLSRISDLIVGQEGKGEMVRKINDALENEKSRARIATEDALKLLEDARLARDGTISLAKAYETRFRRLENRLESIYQELLKDSEKKSYEIIGDTLSEIRIQKRLVKRDSELLAERGLKRVPPTYNFRKGEIIVITKEGEFDGMTGTVVTVDSKEISNEIDATPECSTTWSEVGVILSYDWRDEYLDVDAEFETNHEKENDFSSILKFLPHEIAVWDYDINQYDMGQESSTSQNIATNSIQHSSQRLQNILNSIDLEQPSKSKNVKETTNNSYQSSRQRKAAKATLKKSQKGKKKNSKNK